MVEPTKAISLSIVAGITTHFVLDIFKDANKKYGSRAWSSMVVKRLEDKFNIGRKNSLANFSFFMGVSNDNIDEVISLILDIDYDDAFVAYINGIEIGRKNNR